jgi:hypothetical protein
MKVPRYTARPTSFNLEMQEAAQVSTLALSFNLHSAHNRKKSAWLDHLILLWELNSKLLQLTISFSMFLLAYNSYTGDTL